jgi:hypothetical protein
MPSQEATDLQKERKTEDVPAEPGQDKPAGSAGRTDEPPASAATTGASVPVHPAAEAQPAMMERDQGTTSVDELSSAAMAPAAPHAEMMDETIAAPVPEIGMGAPSGTGMAEAPRPDRANGGGAIKRGVISGLQGVGDVEAQLVHTVRDMVGTTLKATGAAASDAITVVGDVVMQAIVTAEKLGTGVVLAARSIVKGAVLGVSDVGGDVLGAASIATRSTVRAAADRGADVGSTARQAVSGAAEAASETGSNVAAVTRAAITGAVDAVRNVGGMALSSVAFLLLGLARGIKGLADFISPRARTLADAQIVTGVATTGGTKAEAHPAPASDRAA